MRVFLTGASGYVGRHVALELLSRGHQVTGLSRQASERTRSATEIRWRFGDLTDFEAFASAIDDSDAVIHCAMDYSASGENSEADRGFVDHMANYAGHFLYTGNLFSHRFQGVQAEEPETRNGHWRFQSELAALQRPGASSVIRLGFVHGGSGGYLWHILSPGTLALLEGEEIPEVYWPLMHVRDAASLYATVVETGSTGVFHGYDGVALTAREVMQSAREVYASRGITGTVSDGYVRRLLESSVTTSNERSRSTGWSPRYTNFSKLAAQSYSEFIARPT